MKKLTGPNVSLVKSRIRKMINYRLDMAEEKVANLRQCIKGTGIKYVTAIGWTEKIRAQEKMKRFKKRILV
jgi:hypothetical protein